MTTEINSLFTAASAVEDVEISLEQVESSLNRCLENFYDEYPQVIPKDLHNHLVICSTFTSRANAYLTTLWVLLGNLHQLIADLDNVCGAIYAANKKMNKGEKPT